MTALNIYMGFLPVDGLCTTPSMLRLHNILPMICFF